MKDLFNTLLIWIGAIIAIMLAYYIIFEVLLAPFSK